MPTRINTNIIETRRSIECKPDGTVILSEVKVETSTSIEQRQRSPYSYPLDILHDEVVFNVAPEPEPEPTPAPVSRQLPAPRSPEGRPTIARGNLKTPTGYVDGFHVFDAHNQWVGVYNTFTRADAERRSL